VARLPSIGYLSALVLALCACSSGARLSGSSATSERTAYVLSGYDVGAGFAHNALTLIDVPTWQVRRRVELPRSWAKSFARDPSGRLWVGFSGNLRESDTRFDVYSATGDLVQMLRPCTDPEAGISFAAGRAFVACAGNGFSGKLAVIRLDTLVTERLLDLTLTQSRLLLTASAATDSAVVAAGLTDGPVEGRYSALVVVDPQTLVVRAQLQLGPDSDIWRIVSHGERFYILNVGSWHQPREHASDVFILEPADPPWLRAIAIAPSPLWGAVDGNALYAYHNPTWDQSNGDAARRLSRLDLASGELRQWPLPESWNASDLKVMNGQILLAKWDGRSGAEDGLYRFDAESGGLAKQVDVLDASAIILPEVQHLVQ
jgi:hypothetical protein